MSNEIIQALWSLHQDSHWAWKQALEGREPDMHSLGVIWKRLEQLIIAQDHK